MTTNQNKINRTNQFIINAYDDGPIFKVLQMYNI